MNDKRSNMNEPGIQSKEWEAAGQFAFAPVDEFTALEPIPGMGNLQPQSPTSENDRPRLDYPNQQVYPLARYLSVLTPAVANTKGVIKIPDGAIHGRLVASLDIFFSPDSGCNVPAAAETIEAVGYLPAKVYSALFSLIGKNTLDYIAPTASTFISLEFYMPTRHLGVKAN